MDKKKSEFLQALLFLVIVAVQIFLANRYYSRDDVVGMTIFCIVAILAGVAAFGHFIEWRKARK